MQNVSNSKSFGSKRGNAFVERLKEKAPSIGGFGGAFKIPSGYEKPILISGADGVGTKLRLAIDAGNYSSVGQDLVAMSVNDVVVVGAETFLFFSISNSMVTVGLNGFG